MTCHHREMIRCGWLVGALCFLAIGCGSSEQTGSEPPFDGGVEVAIEGSTNGEAGEEAMSQIDGEVWQDAIYSEVDGQDETIVETCEPIVACAAPLPDFGPARGFHKTSSKLTAKIGSPRHRGRDLFLLEGQDAWVLGKFAYGLLDDDIKGEEIDVYLLKDCGNTWSLVGTFLTSEDGENKEVHGVIDTGGRLFVNLGSEGISLDVGRHRIVMVVAGDLTYAEQFIEVIRPQARVVVTDIDGTLTSSEYAALTDVAGLPPAEAHPGAADMLWAFAIRGYKVFYLTARPEWMTPLTREWLPLRGFPPGVLHTTLSKIGAVGSSATDAKTKELAWLHATTTIVPSYAFGNKTSDVAAYGGGRYRADGMLLLRTRWRCERRNDPRGLHRARRCGGASSPGLFLMFLKRGAT